MGEFTNRRTVTARKHHQCGENKCVRTKEIKPGDQYVRITGHHDGSFFHFKLCIRCADLHCKVWTVFKYIHPDEGPPLGDLFWWLKEALS